MSVAPKNEGTSVFDPMPMQWICPACRTIDTLTTEFSGPACRKCGMGQRRLSQTLRPPRYFVFLIVPRAVESEERYFTFLPGQMSEPELGGEVRLPLEEGDPLAGLAEWQEAGGWCSVVKKCVDYQTGSVWFEVHIGANR